MIKVYKTDDVGHKAADILIGCIESALENRRPITFGIGSSVPGVYEHLKYYSPWMDVEFFMVDEVLKPITHPKSRFKLAKDCFLDFLVKEGSLPKENVHPYEYSESSPNVPLKLYNDAFKNLGGFFDVVIASAGEDGQIAGLFPRHHSVNDPSRFFFLIDDAPYPPKERMTASKNILKKTKCAVLLFKGPTKKAVLDKFLSCNDPADCPAVILKNAKELFIVTDQDLPENIDRKVTVVNN